jgi:hypothetical protein
MTDIAHRILSSKINPKFNYSRNFARGPSVSLKSSHSSQKFQEDPWFLKIIPDIALATSKNYK